MDVFKKRQKICKGTPSALRAPDLANPPARVYQFDSFLLDQTERLLLCGRTPVALPPKVFDVLSVLIESAGHLVTKETLLEKVWPDTFVEEANVSINIATLRKILGESAGGQSYIETVRKRGYRFVANVLELEGESALNVLRHEPETVLAGPQESKLGLSQGFSSLAVLPFENESGDPDAEYLADGITESIINSFSHLEDFRVIGRNTVFRYKVKSADPQKIGEELGVGSLLTGRILRLGDQVIIRTEVVDVKGGWQIWGEQYHRTLADLLVVQDEIAKEISTTLRLKLTADEKRRLTKRYTDNSAAYHLYLKGRYHWNKYAHKGLGTAIEYFRKAIAEDPLYASAYAGLSDSYYRLSNLYSPSTEAMPKAKLAAQTAVEIDDSLPEGHAALGSVLMFYDWDWQGAKREFSRAIELNPGCAIAHQRLAQYFNVVSNFVAAMDEYVFALNLDPLSPSICSSVALEFFLMGDHEQAIQQAEKSLEIDPNHPPTHYLLGWIHKRRGDLSKARDSFERVTILDDSSLYLAALGHAYGLNGEQTKAWNVLDQLEKRSKYQYVSSYCRALVYVGLGEKDLAFDWLERAFDERSEMIPWLNVVGECDSIRSDPRFHDLLRRCGLETERVRALRS
jgi:TolB-like protein/Flp pilus assembly protein TadD